MTTVLVPRRRYLIQGLSPDIVRSCILLQPAPPSDTGETPDPPIEEDGIYTPIAPGITYENLPTVTIVDTSPTQMIGCIIEAGTNAQQRLEVLFPSAVEGDGVIDRTTNNIWVFSGTVWNNVGPNPGPTIVSTIVIPPWNEIVVYEARVRTRLEVTSLAYALQLLTEPAAYGISVGMIVQRVMPVTRFTFGAPVPVYVGTRATVIQPGTGTIALSAFAPVAGFDPEVIFSMDGSDGATAVTSIDGNAISATFNGNAQLDTAIKKYGTAALLLNGSGSSDFIEYEAPTVLGTNDFTIEFWAYVATGVTGYSTLVMTSDLYSIDVDADTGEIFYYQEVGDGITHQSATSKDTWFHVALYRISGTAYLAVDGVVCTTPSTESHDFTDTTHRLGDWDGTGNFATACHIDDYRLTIGTAVYGVSDFTPPAAPFS